MPVLGLAASQSLPVAARRQVLSDLTRMNASSPYEWTCCNINKSVSGKGLKDTG